LERVRIAVAFGLFAWLALACGQRAHAASAAGEPASQPKASGVIEIAVIGSASSFESVRGAVAAGSFPQATLRWRRAERLLAADLLPNAEPGAEVSIRSFVDLSDRAHARLYFSDRAAERFLIRDLELSGDLDELDREALSQAFELSVRALLEDHLAGISREEARSIILPRVEPTATQATRPEPVKPQTPPRSGPSASVFWGAEGHSSELGWTQGPGLAIAYDFAFDRARGAVWSSGQYRFEREVRTELVGVALRTISLRAGFDWVRSLGGRAFFAGARLGGGVDLVRFTPSAGSGEDAVILQPTGIANELLLSPGALFGANLAPSLRMTLAIVADVALTQAHYDLDIDGQSARIVDPWSIRPALSLAFSLH
jgi:hypothetical protein